MISNLQRASSAVGVDVWQGCARIASSFDRYFSSGTTLKVGFVGLGNMGSAMASNLMRNGARVVVHDANRQHMERSAAEGARTADSPSALSLEPGIDAIVTMLPSVDSVWSVYTGEGGLLAPSAVHCPLFIDCSTISPSCTKRLAERIASTRLATPSDSPPEKLPRKQVQFVDAPVSGGVPAAKAAKLTFLVGGQDAAVESARAILQYMGSAVHHMGPEGNGQAAKLCNNLVLGASMAAVAEGLALGQSLGLDPATLTRVFNQSSARCWSSDTYNPAPGVMSGVPASNNYNGGFMNRLMIKDLGLAIEASHEQGMPLDLEMCKSALALYQKAAADIGPEKDFSSVFRVYRPEDPSSA